MDRPRTGTACHILLVKANNKLAWLDSIWEGTTRGQEYQEVWFFGVHLWRLATTTGTISILYTNLYPKVGTK